MDEAGKAPMCANPPPSLRKTITGIVFLAFVAGLPISALAEEILLRCDPTTSSQDSSPQVLSIDMSRKTVHWGRNPDSGWWTDGKHYEKKRRERG